MASRDETRTIRVTYEVHELILHEQTRLRREYGHQVTTNAALETLLGLRDSAGVPFKKKTDEFRGEAS